MSAEAADCVRQREERRDWAVRRRRTGATLEVFCSVKVSAAQKMHSARPSVKPNTVMTSVIAHIDEYLPASCEHFTSLLRR